MPSETSLALERDKLSADGELFLYRAKTGVPVRVPLPTELAQLLRSLPSTNPNFFFWSGNGDPETAKKGWQRALRRLFKRAKIKKPDGTPKRCHPHMFRDTFAVELLLSGVPIDQVSLLLGHSSVKVTEKHYAPFVKARQEQLETSARRAWEQIAGLAPARSSDWRLWRMLAGSSPASNSRRSSDRCWC